VNFVSKVLDYDARELALDTGKVKLMISTDLVSIYLVDSLFIFYYAGLPPEDKQKAIEGKEKIRDIFDDYLDRLSLFNRYYESELVAMNDIRPYLDYQVKKIADTAINKHHLRELQKSIWYYIGAYNFKDIPPLFENLGYKIAVPPPLQ